mgnify:CR=1 FL=1
MRLLLLTTLFLSGVGIGWYLHLQQTRLIPVPDLPAAEKQQFKLVTPEVADPQPTEFHQLLVETQLLIKAERFEQAFEHLLDLSYLPVGPVEQDEFRRQLAEFVDTYTRALIAINQFRQVDAFYERLTLSLPQYAEYQFPSKVCPWPVGQGSLLLKRVLMVDIRSSCWWIRARQ